MDTTTAEEDIPWYNRGIFKWFSFTPEMVQKFAIDPKCSGIVRKELKMKLALENVKNSRSNNLTITFKITGSVIYLLTTPT